MTKKDLNSNINNILFIDGRLNKKTKLNTRAIFKILYQLYIEQLVNITTISIIYI